MSGDEHSQGFRGQSAKAVIGSLWPTDIINMQYGSFQDTIGFTKGSMSEPGKKRPLSSVGSQHCSRPGSRGPLPRVSLRGEAPLMKFIGWVLNGCISFGLL